jgi:integrase
MYLLMARLKESTRNAYVKAVAKFVQWLQRYHPQLARNKIRSSELDRILLSYITELQRCGRPVSLAVHTFCGIIMYRPNLRRRLPLSRAALNGWRVLKPSTQHPPLTWPLTCAIAYHMALNGHVRAAVGTVLAFDCLLRIGELISLRGRDVIRSVLVDPELPRRTLLRLTRTKTGDNQSVKVTHAGVESLLSQLAAVTPRRARLLGMDARQYRKLFKASCQSLGLSKAYVPHSLRHGGATRLYMKDTPIEDIRALGRWRSVASCLHYCQWGRAVIGSVRAPKAVKKVANAVAKALVEAITMASHRPRSSGVNSGASTQSLKH